MCIYIHIANLNKKSIINITYTLLITNDCL